jgi:acetate kinase
VNTRVLCVNLGSRTAKLTLLDVPAEATAGEPGAPAAERDTALEDIADDAHLGALDAATADIVAYRIVRTAGTSGALAAPLDERTRADIEAAREFAPLHSGPELAAFDELRARLPRARHVAVFDSAFHHTIGAAAAVYGLPYDAFTHGWRKIGFHGLSHSYAAARTAVLLGDAAPVRKLVSAHLGGGASLCAIDGPRSIDTTMGFTPLDGLIMATRSGSLDPGLLLAYMRRYGLSPDAAEDVLTNRSGLLGLSGSADMRDILAQRDRGDARAALAFDAFVYRVAGAIGAMTAALGGLDAIAFLGGIGENSAEVRAGACAPFAFLGADLDAARNIAPAGDGVVSAQGARVTVLRIRAREDWMMALAATTLA